MTLKQGQRVRYSPYSSVLRSARDYWQGLGREPHKSRAKKHYFDLLDVRGTVEEVTEKGVNVRTDDGALHKSMTCLWIEEDSPLFS